MSSADRIASLTGLTAPETIMVGFPTRTIPHCLSLRKSDKDLQLLQNRAYVFLSRLRSHGAF